MLLASLCWAPDPRALLSSAGVLWLLLLLLLLSVGL
jgi:hypothetical protein